MPVSPSRTIRRATRCVFLRHYFVILCRCVACGRRRLCACLSRATCEYILSHVLPHARCHPHKPPMTVSPPMTISSHMLAVVHTRARTTWFPRPRGPVGRRRRRRRAPARFTARLRATRLVVASMGGFGPGSGIPWPSIGFSGLSPGRARWVGRGLCDHRGGKNLIDALVATFILRLHTLSCTARVCRVHAHARVEYF